MEELLLEVGQAALPKSFPNCPAAKLRQYAATEMIQHLGDDAPDAGRSA